MALMPNMLSMENAMVQSVNYAKVHAMQMCINVNID